MEPDVIRLYSSSPPPLDEGEEEEDEDDFGDFGVYCCGVSTSFSFSETETSSTSGQSNEADTPRPNLTETEKIVPAGLSSPEDFSSGGHGLSSLSELQHIRLCPDPERETPSDLRSVCTPNVLTSGTDFVSGSPILEAGQRSAEFSGSLAFLDDQTAVLKSGKTVRKEERTEIKNEGQDILEDPAELSYTSLDQSVKDHSVFAHTEKSEEPGIQEDDTKALDETSSCEKQITQGAFDDEKVTGDVKESKDSTLCCVVKENTAYFCEVQFTTNVKESARSHTAGEPAVAAETEKEEQFEDTTGDSKGVQDTFTQGSFCEESSMDVSENLAKMTSASATSHPMEELFKDTTGAPKVEPDEVDSKGTRDDFTQGFGDVTGFADFVTMPTCCSTDGEFADTDSQTDLKDEEPSGDDEDGLFSELPLSESFADFSSAPFGGLAGAGQECWSAFSRLEQFGGQKDTWASFGEENQSEPSDEGLTSELVSDFFQNIFSFEINPEDLEVQTLETLLELTDHEQLRESLTLWRHLLDIHGAHGLRVQWVGSRSNRILLDCLGIHNILFTGQKKQPLIVPMFAAGLGMLEPTKDPVNPSPVFSSLSPSRGRSTLCTQQVAASLNFYQDEDTIAHLNLDFFGPLEDSSSDSDDDTTLPGVDPELYDLTTAGMDSSATGTSTADAFTRLMESIEKNSTVTRRPEIDEHISEEAVQVLSILPDLSFMKARVLMFPSTLTPTLSHL